jgi:hypothetical protein
MYGIMVGGIERSRRATVMKPRDKKLAQRDEDIELHPDAWERFTEFVKRIAKAGPQHRTKKGTAIDQRQGRRKEQRSNDRG